MDRTVLRKIAVCAVVIYVFLIGALYFLMGEQLHFRDSRGNTKLPTATAGAVELVQGAKVEQVFVSEVQRLERILIQWGAFYRANTGSVQITLTDHVTGEVLLQQLVDVSTIAEGTVISLESEIPLENSYGRAMRLELVSPDGYPGNAVTPLIHQGEGATEEGLYINAEPTPGSLCFAVEGTDYIWTGLHYWKFAAALGALLVLFFLYLDYCVQKGKKNAVLYAFVAVKKYSFLMRQLISRDFKTKYKRSILGIFWSFLNPLLTMAVQYIIFSTLFKNDIPHFAIYLLIGVVMFNFFSEACNMCMVSILGNASLITKVYVPKYIYPLSRTLSSGVNLLISLLPLLISLIVAGVPLHKSVFLIVFPLCCLFVFVLGLGMLLSTMMVFFRDMQFLWGIISMLWMYATPIFYPETILSENLRSLIQFNPLYQFIKFARVCVLDGISPEPVVYFRCAAIALAMLLVGALTFKRNQDKFILYI